jgi:uncharacterized iron-regulated membrane protein
VRLRVHCNRDMIQNNAMTLWDRLLHRPHSLWVRKAMFQIHLWTGIALGLYVVAISVSGSAIVFRNELYKSLWPGPKIVAITGPRLSKDELKQKVRQSWPKYSVTYIWESKRKDEATEVWIEKDGQAHPKTVGRLVNPFTGEDLGPSRPYLIGVLAWMSDLHTNLLAGKTGREVNGLMSIVVVLMSVTGLLIWWPGKGRLRRSLTIDFRANWKRLNWDLHSVVGVWMFAFVFIWGVTGVYLVFPTPFQEVVNKISPLKVYTPLTEMKTPVVNTQIIQVADDTPPPQPRRRKRQPPRGSNGDVFLRWFYYLHFGNFGDWGVKATWVVLGLSPVFLFVTGALMWWNRVLSREARAVRRRPRQTDAVPKLSSVAS